MTNNIPARQAFSFRLELNQTKEIELAGQLANRKSKRIEGWDRLMDGEVMGQRNTCTTAHTFQHTGNKLKGGRCNNKVKPGK